MRIDPHAPGMAWAALAALMAAGAVLVHFIVTPTAVDWQPALWLSEPWRWWTGAFVHLSPTHFAANLFATGLLALFGMFGEVPCRTTLAWAAAWPITHLGLLTMPALHHYGGLSGLLHAGAGAAALFLAVSGQGRQRAVGFAVLALLCAKVLSETPWAAAVQTSPHWDIPVAPIAHLTGAVAGVLCSAIAEVLNGRRSPRGTANPAASAPNARDE